MEVSTAQEFTCAHVRLYLVSCCRQYEWYLQYWKASAHGHEFGTLHICPDNCDVCVLGDYCIYCVSQICLLLTTIKCTRMHYVSKLAVQACLNMSCNALDGAGLGSMSARRVTDYLLLQRIFSFCCVSLHYSSSIEQGSWV